MYVGQPSVTTSGLIPADIELVSRSCGGNVQETLVLGGFLMAIQFR